MLAYYNAPQKEQVRQSHKVNANSWATVKYVNVFCRQNMWLLLWECKLSKFYIIFSCCRLSLPMRAKATKNPFPVAAEKSFRALWMRLIGPMSTYNVTLSILIPSNCTIFTLRFVGAENIVIAWILRWNKLGHPAQSKQTTTKGKHTKHATFDQFHVSTTWSGYVAKHISNAFCVSIETKVSNSSRIPPTFCQINLWWMNCIARQKVYISRICYVWDRKNALCMRAWFGAFRWEFHFKVSFICFKQHIHISIIPWHMTNEIKSARQTNLTTKKERRTQRWCIESFTHNFMVFRIRKPITY